MKWSYQVLSSLALVSPPTNWTLVRAAPPSRVGAVPPTRAP
ncbi:MAG: hypothetical protein QM767_03930 [Anaeromyxobacter sp.]